MKTISEYYGRDEYTGRRASVVKTPGNYYMVNMYKNNILIESRDLKGYSNHYAEDCAENWVTGIIRG